MTRDKDEIKRQEIGKNRETQSKKNKEKFMKRLKKLNIIIDK